jgi:ribosomal protein S18 acetylase RimI-like enzyme
MASFHGRVDPEVKNIGMTTNKITTEIGSLLTPSEHYLGGNAVVATAGHPPAIVGTALYYTPENSQGTVDYVLVDPNYRRRGVATEMLETLTTVAQQQGLTRLTLISSGPIATALYNRAGFTLSQDCEGDPVMYKNL